MYKLRQHGDVFYKAVKKITGRRAADIEFDAATSSYIAW
jgi:hypothetical protein